MQHEFYKCSETDRRDHAKVIRYILFNNLEDQMKHHAFTFVLTFAVSCNNALDLLARLGSVEPKCALDYLSI